MKQIQVKNKRLQSWFNYWTGWRETALLIVLWVVAIALAFYARSVK